MQQLVRNNINYDTMKEFLTTIKSKSKDELINSIYKHIALFDDEFMEKYNIQEDKIAEKKLELISVESGFPIEDFDGIMYIQNQNTECTFIVKDGILKIDDMIEISYEYISEL